MRLLHTTELRFEEFFDDRIPEYAILSHRWEDNEVSYQDFLSGRKKNGAGYAKIVAFCQLAATFPSGSLRHRSVPGPFKWVWIDTCCIDKSSSAELSEAINSMYHWYANARVCYAYLSDVTQSDEPDQTIEEFETSQWFGRGWTLQELLAPPFVLFIDKDWTYIGTRNSLATNIAAATRISQDLVKHFWDMSPDYICAAEKLTWIVARTTSRTEDQAYCIWGLFGVNMPLLYGEGGNAFRRFQLEILRSTNDESIFLWPIPDDPQPGRHEWEERYRLDTVGLLARNKNDFGPFHYRRLTEVLFKRGQKKVPRIRRPPYTVTNQGLEIRVPKKLTSRKEFFWPLNHRIYNGDDTPIGVCAILLRATDNHGFSGWHRTTHHTLPQSLPQLPAVKYERGVSTTGIFIAPESWLWSREQLAQIETELIYVRL